MTRNYFGCSCMFAFMLPYSSVPLKMSIYTCWCNSNISKEYHAGGIGNTVLNPLHRFIRDWLVMMCRACSCDWQMG